MSVSFNSEVFEIYPKMPLPVFWQVKYQNRSKSHENVRYFGLATSEWRVFFWTYEFSADNPDNKKDLRKESCLVFD